MLKNERGMLLVIVMVILLVVSALAGANLINAMLERSLAKNQNYASIALQAAEGGIAQGITWLNQNQTLLPNVAPWNDNADWPREVANGRAIVRDISRDLNGDGDATDPGEQAAYTVSMRFKREWRDYSSPADGDCVDPGEDSGYHDVDGSPATSCPGEIVLYNNAASTLDGGFNFSASLYPLPAEGYPVVEIEAVGRHGAAGYRKIVLDVARNRLAAQVDGAFTARSGVSASGSSMTDGRNHDMAGNLLPAGTGCNEYKPGIMYDTGIAMTETCPNANIVGGPPCVDNNPPSPIKKTPWEALGLATQAEFESMFTKRTDSVLDQPCNDVDHPYYLWYAGTGGVGFNNASACNSYFGILVIHNEAFDPDFWEASCPAGEATLGCAGKAPAVFDMNGNVAWKGIVIADQVVKVNGTPSIIGGILSLASGGIIESSITGNIDIKYSCEAVTGAANQGYKTRLAWHRIR